VVKLATRTELADTVARIKYAQRFTWTDWEANGTENTVGSREEPLSWMMKPTNSTKLAISSFHIKLTFGLSRFLGKYIFSL
jgi:hypothetical protein